MKRILPIILVLALLIAVLVSCGPKDVPTTTLDEPATEVETTVPTTPSRITTTKKTLNMGIDEVDEGWSFWGDY